MLATQWLIMGRLQDLCDEYHDKGEHDKCDLIKQVLEAPRHQRRAMLRAVVAGVERMATPVDFYGSHEGEEEEAKGILDILTWLLSNADKIIAFIKQIIELFKPQATT